MDVCGEAIYGTRPIAPYAEGGVRFTQKGGWVYAFLIGGDVAEIRSLAPSVGSAVSCLGTDEPATCEVVEGGVRIALPRSAGSLPSPRVVKFRVGE